MPPESSPGASLVLGAFVALAGPPDLLVRCADRSEPTELHPHLGMLISRGWLFWEAAVRPAPRLCSARSSLSQVRRTCSSAARTDPNPVGILTSETSKGQACPRARGNVRLEKNLR